MNTNSVAKKFRDFAYLECEGSSELYKNLAIQIAENSELLNICLHARAGQPIPNLFFGAVHYLLLQGVSHKLKMFYPSIVDEVEHKYDPFPLFKDFCMKNIVKIKSILKEKRVQTNEVRRCAYLYPTFCFIYDQMKKPLSLIEIGTSAGLQLLWDQYAYTYNDNRSYGNKNASLHLTSRVRTGDIPHHLLALTPPVNDRLGIDLNISDLTDAEDYEWLKALIWPEHNERLKDFETAVRQLRINPPSLIEGDGVSLLPQVVRDVPDNTTLCIFHTHVANQMPGHVKNTLIKKIHEIGRQRNVFHIYNNMGDKKLHIDAHVNGNITKYTVGETDGHARWFDWDLSAESLA